MLYGIAAVNGRSVWRPGANLLDFYHFLLFFLQNIYILGKTCLAFSRDTGMAGRKGA